ncbi:hypothetical protein T10_12825 [Trichinella papuae]|uniref:Uncharacterized protein n=1 Tax=Trichinella papuae TaxID=268474 RepID=A0A0V1NB35_9BILA|nr:hypothetical protein T10_12825 [Trichinella papuae]
MPQINVQDLLQFTVSIGGMLVKHKKPAQTRKRGRGSSEEASQEPSTSARASSRRPGAVPTNIWKDQGGHWPKVVEQKRHCQICHWTVQLRSVFPHFLRAPLS